MANWGTSTNGLVFFITHVPTNGLDEKPGSQGEFLDGLKIVNEIKQDDLIEYITIYRVGDDAEKWNSLDEFNNFKAKKEILVKENQLKEQQIIETL